MKHSGYTKSRGRRLRRSPKGSGDTEIKQKCVGRPRGGAYCHATSYYFPSLACGCIKGSSPHAARVDGVLFHSRLRPRAAFSRSEVSDSAVPSRFRLKPGNGCGAAGRASSAGFPSRGSNTWDALGVRRYFPTCAALPKFSAITPDLKKAIFEGVRHSFSLFT